ncbi:MAG TPA: class I SAM-dependent methyltransferase [Hyphomicrobiales bacterium]|nr:class I SAM-dependent methyltransferase [Hyphomicrobiales bacterium]
MKIFPRRWRARSKADYGIEGTRAIIGLLVAGLAAIAAGLAVPTFYLGTFRIFLIGPTLLALGCLSLAFSASTLAFALRGKFNICDHMLRMVRWRGDETVLEVGTGLGLLAVGAAKRLRSGTVTAIDLWEPSAAPLNAPEKVQRNIELEGVQDRVDLRSDDIRDIGFVDNSFDVVFSLLCLHTIGESEDREAACLEIARVLKPRGIVIIADNAYMAEYAQILKEAGLKVQGPKPEFFRAYMPLSILTATKL